MANLNVCRNGGLGDIINLLYFCNYYKKSGHNINFVCGEKFYDFIKLQKVTNTVNDKLLKNNYFNLTFDGREHSDLKQINNNVFDIFYRHGNNLIKTEPLYFEIKTDKECDEKVLNLYPIFSDYFLVLLEYNLEIFHQLTWKSKYYCLVQT